MNRIQLKALLLDSITHYKHGKHLSYNATHVKKQYCKMIGISNRTTSKKMIDLLYWTFCDNGLKDEVEATLIKFNVLTNRINTK